MNTTFLNDASYSEWLKEIKHRIHFRQQNAIRKVNSELVHLYWELGKTIVERQMEAKWGDGFLEQLSKDLILSFPEMKGFSLTNLKHIRSWYLFYNQPIVIGQQAVDQLQSISGITMGTSAGNTAATIQQLVLLVPWGHNIQIINKSKGLEEALFYVSETIKNNWSRAVLVHQMESNLYNRQGSSIHNFSSSLPPLQSDLAQELFKDPYVFNFLQLGNDFREKELEDALVSQITNFLLELGAGFAYVGKQYQLSVNGDDYFLDLLFYHLKLRCYVVVELKTGKFKPEYAGKMSFYLSAVDALVKDKRDGPSIGMLICKEKNKVVAEYTLKDMKMPMGVAEYKLSETLPKEIKENCPSIEAIEKGLKY